LYSIKRKLPCTRRIKINDIDNTQNNSTSPTFPNQSNHHVQAQFDHFQSQIDHLTTHLSQSVQVIIEEMDHLNQWKAQSDAVLNQLTQLTQPSPNLLSVLDVLSGFQRGYYERRSKLEKIAHSITALPMNKDISHANSNSLDIPLKRESNDEPLTASIDTPNTSEGPKPKRGKTAKLKKLHEQVKQQQREMQMQKKNSESLNAIPESGHLASSVNSLNSALPPSAMNTNIAITGANLQRPRNQMEPPKDIDEALAWTWTVPPNVLLVDDDPICRDMYSKCLQKLGCSFDIAADGAEAVNKMHTRKYDMVLMDIWMPQMDGLSATTIIRQFDQQTPIIAITGDYRETDKGFYLGQGINEVLGKPFKIDQLGECMQKHWVRFCIDRRNPASSSMANQNPAFNVGNNFMNGMDQGFVMGSEASIPIDHQGQSYSDGVRGLGS
jgi:osomolarity two-component system response regulator SKN7